MRPFRQGDVLLVPLSSEDRSQIERELQRSSKTGTGGWHYVRRRKGQGLILAEGEATGHHHQAREPRARLIRKGDKLYLRTPKNEPVVLVHEEHDDVVLPADTMMEVVRQREHVPAKRPARGGRGGGSSTRRVWD